MPRRNRIQYEPRRFSIFSAEKPRRRNGGRKITPPVLRAAPPLLVSGLKPLPARRHIEPRTRYLTTRHITFRFGSATHSPRRYILLLFYKNSDLLEIQIVLKKYWTGRLLIPQILTSGRLSFLRRLTTRMLCWGTRQSIPRFSLPISKVSGNVPMRINRLHSVEDTTAFTRRRALINTFPFSTPQSCRHVHGRASHFLDGWLD